MKEIITLTQELIRFRTVKDNPQEIKSCVNFIKKYLSGCGVLIQEFESAGKPSLFITYTKTKRPKILLNGHLDVVEGEEEQFIPKITGGKLYGRGAVDMKAGLAIMLFLMKELADQKPDMGLMIVSDEEIGGTNGTKFLSSCGFGGEFILAPEPNHSASPEQLNITIAEKGVLWLKVSSSGKACHGSRPWLGKNAIEQLIEGYTQIKKLFPETDKQNHWEPTINLGAIRGGDSPNRVPDYAEMLLDIRFTAETNPRDIVEKIKSIPGIQVEVMEQSPTLNNSSDEPLIKQLKSCAEKITGKEVNLTKEHGASDLRFFSEKGIPAVIFGPMGENFHGKDEFVYIASVESLYKTLKKFILSVG